MVAGILAGTTASTWLAAPSLKSVIAVAAAIALVTALAEERLSGVRQLRRFAPLAGAAVAAAVGIRFRLTAVPPLDVLLTVLWLGGAPSALRMLDEPADDRARVVAAAGMAVAAVLISPGAGGGGAAVGAATAGAALAMVASRASASATVGDAAWPVVGLLLGVATLEASAGLAPAQRALVPLLLWAVPLADAAVATLARLRRGHPLGDRQGGHLVRRLERRGLGRRAATAVLVGGQLSLTTVAVAMGRDQMTPLQAVTLAVVLLVALVAMVWRHPVHSAPPKAFPRWARRLALAVVLVPPALAAPAVITLVGARATLEAAADTAKQALSKAKDGDSEEATAAFTDAAERFTAVSGLLRGPLPSLGLAVPGLSTNLKAARVLAESGRDLAVSGRDSAGALDLKLVRFQGGALPLDQVKDAGAALSVAAETFRRVTDRLGAVDRTYLLPVVSRRLDELAAQLGPLTGDVETAAQAARLMPAIFGEATPRRYFLAVQNTAEARSTGGAIGNFGELVAEGGKIRVERFGRVKDLRDAGVPPEQRVLHSPPQEYVDRYGRYEPQSTWQNVNMSPDFPTVARVISDLYPQSGGRPVDGVIAIDPAGLAALLELTGGVNVSGFGERITSENVVRITLSDAYENYSKSSRIDFLAEVADKVVVALTGGDVKSPAQVARVLGDASRQHHLMMFLRRPEEQRLLARVRADGAVPAPKSDSVFVTNQNAGANKLDYYLRRTLHYSVRLDPDAGSSSARATANLDVTFGNQSPASGLDPYVIGPNVEGLAAGENYSIVSVYGRLDLDRATVDGVPVQMEGGTELGHNVHTTFLRIAAQTHQTLHLALSGSVPLDPGGWYTLQLLRRPTIAVDEVEVDIEVPSGWRIAEAVGLQTDGQRAGSHLELDRDEELRVRLVRD
ncbi:MAG: DUF4012 domain-containing protein [Acidimicrobiales bacterium]